MDSAPKRIGELIAQALARYVTVHPEGLSLRPGEVVDSLAATLLGFHAARTRYESRRPACRSLDGVRAQTEGRTCAECLFRKRCTPQVCVDLWVDGLPARLLLAFTSLRNFLAFVNARRKKGESVEGGNILIAVRNRGHWGEVYFLSNPTATPTPPTPEDLPAAG